MSFWTTVNESTHDPKRNFRWKINIGTMTDAESGNPGVVWWAKKVTKPNFVIAETKHNFLNHTFYWPGRTEWQTVSMTLVDPVSPGAVSLTNQIIEQSGYKVPGDAGVLETMSKAKAIKALQYVKISQLDSAGEVLEEWELKNPFIKMAKFGDLDYENDELTLIELEFRYDYAVCSIKDGSPSGDYYEKITSTS